ncbi:MAG: hypothetical protein AAF757_17875 [Cyanobacteria bacterium P01_D01_bin.116]
MQKYRGVDYKPEQNSEPIKKLISNPNLALEIARRHQQLSQEELKRQKQKSKGIER